MREARRFGMKAKVLAAYDEGVSYSKIADRFDVSIGYVSATVQRRKHGGQRPTDVAWWKRKREASNAQE